MDLENNPLTEVAMEIILHAGDARMFIQQALDAVAAFDYDTATAKLAEARREWTLAHHAQTDTIQAETAGTVRHEYSMLFTHAQDTLMTINSEYIVAQKLVALARAIDERLKKLERVP